jgi:hypothetical protein
MIQRHLWAAAVFVGSCLSGCGPDASGDVTVDVGVESVDGADGPVRDATAEPGDDANRGECAPRCPDPMADAAPPEPDAARPEPDAAPPEPDAAPPEPDAAPPEPDAAPPECASPAVCVPGDRRCQQGGPSTCELDPNGCAEWVVGQPCADDASCQLDRCVPRCQDECAAGASTCEVGGPVGARVCGQHDDDLCLEWGPALPCPAGDVCADGACAACADRPEAPNGRDDNCNGLIDEAPRGTLPTWCIVQWPPVLETRPGTPTSTTYGRVYTEGLTEAAGAHPGVVAQVGFGPVGSDPSGPGWQFTGAAYNLQIGNDDEYMAVLVPELAGQYDYAWRFSVDGGQTFGHCDVAGTAQGAYVPAAAGHLGVFDSPQWGNLQFPHELLATSGEETDVVYGQVFLAGVTDRPGPGAGLRAELGVGTEGADPAQFPQFWRWAPGVYNVDVGANDEYMARLTAGAPGRYDYAWRYSADDGRTWLYADTNGTDDGYDPGHAGALTVRERNPIPGCADDWMEDNDTRDTAFLTGPGFRNDLQLCNGDHDWYAIEVCAGGVVGLDATFDDDNLDMAARLFDGRGALVDVSDNAFPASHLNYASPRAQTVYAEVYGDVGPYSLAVRVDCEAGLCFEDRHEPNDQQADAVALAEGWQRDLSICANEADFFAVDVCARGEVGAIVTFEQARGELEVHVLDARGRIVGMSPLNVDGRRISNYTAFAAQTVFVRVRGRQAQQNRYDMLLLVTGCD